MANTRLVRYIESIEGVATSSELKASGFSAGAIAYALETGLVDKLTRGVYCTPDVFEDDFIVIDRR